MEDPPQVKDIMDQNSLDAFLDEICPECLFELDSWNHRMACTKKKEEDNDHSRD